MVQLLWFAVWQFLEELNIELPHDPVRPLLGIHPRKLKTQVHTKPCILYPSSWHPYNSQKVGTTLMPTNW